MIENTSTAVKSRGPIEALKDGNKLYMDNFARLFKRSWTTGILYAIVTGAYTTAIVNNAGFLVLGTFSILFYVMIAAMLSQGFATLVDYHENGSIPASRHWYGTFNLKTFGRIFKFNLSMLLPFLAVSILSATMFILSRPLGLILSVVVGCITMFILILFTLPFCYSEYQYILDKKTKLTTAYGKSYVKGLHHLPTILGTFLLCAIGVFVITQFLQLPQTILIIANMIANRDIAMGDAATMPNYMIWLEPLLFSISGFIQGYLLIFMIYPFYFIYISINNK